MARLPHQFCGETSWPCQKAVSQSVSPKFGIVRVSPLDLECFSVCGPGKSCTSCWLAAPHCRALPIRVATVPAGTVLHGLHESVHTRVSNTRASRGTGRPKPAYGADTGGRDHVACLGGLRAVHVCECVSVCDAALYCVRCHASRRQKTGLLPGLGWAQAR